MTITNCCAVFWCWRDLQIPRSVTQTGLPRTYFTSHLSIFHENNLSSTLSWTLSLSVCNLVYWKQICRLKMFNKAPKSNISIHWCVSDTLYLNIWSIVHIKCREGNFGFNVTKPHQRQFNSNVSVILRTRTSDYCVSCLYMFYIHVSLTLLLLYITSTRAHFDVGLALPARGVMVVKVLFPYTRNICFLLNPPM